MDEAQKRHQARLHRQIGLRLSQRRKDLGVSQRELADVLGITFQQVQKYENATNRISAVRLHLAAVALHVPINWFFDIGGDC